MNSFQHFLKSMGTGRLLGVLIGGAVSLGLIYFLISQMGGTPMAMLFTDVDNETSGEIVTDLNASGVKFELKDGGATIYVEETEKERLRMKYAGNGLSVGSVIGYEIFDNADALGATSFVQNINNVRALQGELARTISSIDMIESARVHLNIPKRQIFAKEQDQATASILVRSRGRIPAGSVQAIQHLVASAVPGLSPNGVSITDERGELLAGQRQGEDGLAGPTAEDRQKAKQQKLQSEIYDQVTNIVGVGNAHITVLTEVDYNTVTEESELYDPDGQVLSSSNIQEEIKSSTDRDAQIDNSISVANSLPGAQGSEAEPSEPTSVSSHNKTSENLNYLVSMTKRIEVIVQEDIKKITASVLVNGSYTTEEDGTRTYVPRSPEVLESIRRLVATTIGYDEARGDLITVENLQFEMPEPLGDEVDQPGMFSFSSAQMTEVAQTLIIGIVIILLTLLVIKPLMAAVLAPRSAADMAFAGAGGQVALSGETVAADGTPLPPQAVAQGGGGQQALPAPSKGPKIDLAMVEGQVQESAVKQVGEIVQNHPEETVAILRNWLHSSE